MEALRVIGETWAHPPDARSQHVEGAAASTEMKILLPGLAGAAVNPSRYFPPADWRSQASKVSAPGCSRRMAAISPL